MLPLDLAHHNLSMNNGATIKLPQRLNPKGGVAASLAGAWQDPSTRRSMLLTGWFAVFWFILAGGWREGLVGIAFVSCVVLPVALVIQQSLLSSGFPKILAQPLAAALTLIVVPLIFLVRKLVPLNPVAVDVLLCATITIASFVVARFSGTFRPRLPSISFGEAAWLAVVIPVAFIAPRMGNEVRVGDQVMFYGPTLMDFGNLRVVVNLLTHSTFHVPAPVDTCGTLIYHWLYFATPAWLSHFLGGHMDSGTALVLVNFITGVLFFRCVALACNLVVLKGGFSGWRWAPLGACLAVSGASLGYFYAFAAKAHLVPMGERNQLMLQIPSSMSTFGNNTLALCLILLALTLLMAWNDGGPLPRLMLAAVLAGFVPAFSITLAPTVGLGIGLACLTGAVRRGWLALSVFVVAGALSLTLLTALGYFKGSASVPVMSFDGGQFLQNAVLAFPLVVAASLWCCWKHRASSVCLFACMVLATVILPTTLYVAGDPDVPSLMSMKHATLLVTAGIPLVSLALATWWEDRTTRSLLWRRIAVALVLLGFVNSGGYMLATPLTRMGHNIQPSSSIPAGYFDALQHIRRTTPIDALVIDPTGAKNAFSNPVNIFAARRAILPSEYDLTWRYTNDKVERRRAAWQKWNDSGLSDEESAAYLAACADCLVSSAEVKSAHWKLDARFGSYVVYRSLSRIRPNNTRNG